jgi:hypothetical protein
MANINKIRLSGTTYNIQDPNAQPLLTAGQGITIENNVISVTGGGSITVDTALDSGSTNPVENRVIYNKIDEVEEVTAAGLNALNDKINPTVELTQAQYNALVSGGTVDPNTFYIITDATAGDLAAIENRLSEDEEVTAAGLNVLNESKQDTLVSGTNIKTINNESILGSGNINIQGGGGTVESAITSGSTNAVESKAIWSATTFNKGVLLTFNEYNSTNYPEGCGKLVVNVGGYGSNIINFKNNEGWYLGRIEIQNIDGITITVDTSEFGGATYEISGTTVILSYPSTGITSVQTYQTQWTYTAVVEGAWVNDNTYMKSEVDAIASGLQNNINSKLDATAYTPTDLSNYYTKSETSGATEISTALASKADTATTYTKTEVDAALSGYVTTNTEQTISGRKIFTYTDSSGKAIEFKQTSNTAKVGFRVLNSASTNNELATFELRPNTFTINGAQHPLLYLGHYRSKNTGNAGVPQTVIGFRQYDNLNSAAYHYLMPLPEKAKTPFSLTTSFKDYYAPMGFKNGSTMITANDTGVVDLSSELDGLKLKKISQAAYDNLQVKDQNTLYIIVN